MEPKHEILTVPWFRQVLANDAVQHARHFKMQNLWAGYGAIYGVQVEYSEANGGRERRLVVKVVRPPPTARAGHHNSTTVSHQRKLRSYQIECAFYQRHVPELLKCITQHRLPCHLAPCWYTNATSANASIVLILSDLRRAYPLVEPAMNATRTRAALDWLAAFHAYFWHHDNDSQVWSRSGYWHLATRPDELRNMSWRDLQDAAPAIDERLGAARLGRTLVHGDFKAANLLFDQKSSVNLAAVDFQYVGRGYGMKDVVMLLVSSAEMDLTDTIVDDLLLYYHGQVLRFLSMIHPKRPHAWCQAYSLDMAKQHFELCLLDYVRFMDGWGYWGTNADYATSKARAVLAAMMMGSAKRMTAENWKQAVWQRYPLDVSS